MRQVLFLLSGLHTQAQQASGRCNDQSVQLPTVLSH
jgi:hypothetical protein